MISFRDVNDYRASIEIVNNTPIASFKIQFSDIEISDISEGIVNDSSLIVSHTKAIVSGFAINDSYIPMGRTKLFDIRYTSRGKICIDNVSIKDSEGDEFVVDVDECVIFDENKISGCTDSKACNYNDNANDDNGLCTYEKICDDGSKTCDDCLTHNSKIQHTYSFSISTGLDNQSRGMYFDNLAFNYYTQSNRINIGYSHYTLNYRDNSDLGYPDIRIKS